jgi:hypothetical protein
LGETIVPVQLKQSIQSKVKIILSAPTSTDEAEDRDSKKPARSKKEKTSREPKAKKEKSSRE